MSNYDWNTLEVLPPDKLIQVQDKNGNIANAYPTYYPFKLGKNKTGGRWDNELIACEPYWDGGWIINCGASLESNIDSDIVKWRTL
jgi:hypothetical protein